MADFNVQDNLSLMDANTPVNASISGEMVAQQGIVGAKHTILPVAPTQDNAEDVNTPSAIAYSPIDILREQMHNFSEGREVTLDSAIDSALSPDATVAWVLRNRKINEDYYIAKETWNGVVGLVNILPKMSKAFLDAGIASKKALYEANPEKNKYLLEEINTQEELLKGVVGVIDAIDSAGYEDVSVKTTKGKFLAAVARNVPQIIAQAATYNYAGATASMGLMFAQIFGEQYYQLTKEGVDNGRAAKAAFINASVQSALERVGIGSWMKVTRGGSVSNATKTILKAIMEEGGTEAIQELPEQFTDLWAKNPELSPESIASLWHENMGANVENMVMAGAVGALFGGVGGSINSIGVERAKADFQNSNINRLGESIKQDIKEGVNPMYVGVTSDTNFAQQNIDNKAYIEAKALNGFLQTVNETDANHIALLMGTTVDNIKLKAQQGGEIETTIGGVESAGVATKGALFEAIKKNLTFDLNEKSINESEQYQKMYSAAYKLDVQETTELNAEVDKIFEKSNLPKEQAESVKSVFSRMAISASQGENPAEWLRKHPLEVQRTFETITNTNNGVNQTAWHGSPYNFDKFDLGAIGSGSGLQANGWGLYFAKDKKIAQCYTHFGADSRLYKVDIPEDNTMLDEKKTIGRQSDEVKTALKSITDNITDEQIENLGYDSSNAKDKKAALSFVREHLKGANGKNVYELICDLAGGSKEGSILLSQNGVKGIKHDDKGNVTYVVFDDKAIDIIESYNKAVNGQVLGNTQWDLDGKATINLFDGSDVSTVMHEVMHYFLEAINTDVKAGVSSEQQIKDLETLLKYAGTTTADFQKMTEDQKRTYHERIAEAFETYLMERKAPSFEIKKIFDKIKSWMLSIYQNRKRNENAIPLTDEVAAVFDSMLASEEALREVEVADGYLASLPKEVVNQLDEKSRAKLREMLLKVHDKAVDILAKRANESFSDERKKAIAEYQKEILPVVAQQIQTMPLYQAIAMLRKFTNIALEGKGDKANVRAIARRYLNQEGKAYADWKEELNSVNAELDDLILPVIEDLESGMGHGVTIVETPEEVQGGSNYYRYSNNEEWYQNWYAEYGHRPNKEELRELAIKNLTGKAGKYTTRSMTFMPDDVAIENETKIKELLARKEMLEEQKEKASLGRKKGLSQEDMDNFTYVAEYNGFANGQELAFQILNMPTEKQAINSRINEYTQMQFPDFWKEKASAIEAAKEALYNDPHAELIALEEQLMYDALNTTLEKQQSHQAKMQIAKSEAEAAKAEAFARIKGMTVREARLPRRFIADERRAAVNAAVAMTKGDIENALKYKHQQLVAHQMVGMSMAFREEHMASLRYVRGLAKKQGLPTKNKKSFWYNEDIFYAAAELMTRMGLKVKDYNVELHYGKNDLINTINNLSAQGWEFVIDQDFVNGNLDISRPDGLSVEEFQNAVNGLRNFRAVANAINSSNQELKAKTWEETKVKVLEELNKLKTVFVPTAGERNKMGTAEELQTSARSTDNLWEMMDGWTYGYFNKTWGAMLKHCADKESKMIDKWDKQTQNITETWAKKMKEKGLNVDEKFSIPELGKDAAGNAVAVNRHHLVAMLCYLGSQSGADRLCGTPLASIAQSDVWVAPADNSKAARAEAIDATKKNLKAVLQQYVTKEDIEYAQEILDACGQWWPELEKLNRKTIGFVPDKVMAVPQTYSLANGDVVTMHGGYCPLARNGDTGSHPTGIERMRNLDTDERFQGRFVNSMNTATAASSNRTNAAYPVDISQGWFDIAIRDTVHDICYREAMQDFKKLLNDDEIYNTLRSKLGIAATAQLREMLETTAHVYNNSSMNLAESTFIKGANWLRQKTVNVAILWNFKTALQNLSNMFLFGNAVDGFSYSDVAAAVFGHFGLGSFSPAGVKRLDALCSKSVFFNERAKFIDFSIRDIVEKNKMSKLEKSIAHWGTAVLVATDNLTAKPVWAAAYSKKINQGATEQEAIDFADAIIRRTLGSSRAQDVSSMQRGGAFMKLFTTFQSFFNTQYNQWAREYNIDKKLWTEGQRKEAMFRITTFVAAKYLFVCLVSSAMALENPFGTDDKDKRKYMNISKELMMYPLSMYGPVGQAANVFVQKGLGLRTYGYRMTAAQSSIEKIGNAFAAIGRGMRGETENMQDFIEPAVGVVTFGLGVPDQMNKLFWNAWDIVMNDMDPEWSDLMRRRPKRKR